MPHRIVPLAGGERREGVAQVQDDLPGRRLQPDLLTRSEAEARPKERARIERASK